MYRLGILCLVIIILLFVYSKNQEGFATRREKAATIYEWFKKNPSPTYTKYKSEFYGNSNVVEYENILNLSQSAPNFTLESVEKTM